MTAKASKLGAAPAPPGHLLASVLTDPHDPLPRLALADFFEEAGRERRAAALRTTPGWWIVRGSDRRFLCWCPDDRRAAHASFGLQGPLRLECPDALRHPPNGRGRTHLTSRGTAGPLTSCGTAWKTPGGWRCGYCGREFPYEPPAPRPVAYLHDLPVVDLASSLILAIGAAGVQSGSARALGRALRAKLEELYP